MSHSPPRHRALARTACQFCLALILAGCSTWHAPAQTDIEAPRDRAVSETSHGVRTSAAVLGSEDSMRMFGADVSKSGVQPLWVEVQNGTSQPLWLLRAGTDPDYYSPHEVAWSLHSMLGGTTNASIDQYFGKLGFRNPIPPGETRTGVLFTNPDHELKLANFDLLGNQTLIPFSLLLQVPGGKMDPNLAQIPFPYPESVAPNYQDLASLRAALEHLPCCATDASGTVQADPLNAVGIGQLTDIGAALVRRNFRRDEHPFDQAQRLFGRAPDFVMRKEAQGGAPATWIRGWLAPMRFQGQLVYVAQVGRPVGGRFLPRGESHQILHENVDEARNLLIQDLMYSGGLEKLGFVNGVGPVSESHQRSTAGGAAYYTDGLRAVLFFATRPLSLSDVEFLDWVPYLEAPPVRQYGGAGNARQ
ncbi:LssY C-terminal domain-containing protein [Cupriavidus sp. BIS7]|uniref:LssY C-terminal domain-containing protein n=1 Tax=Cupriavidus sp. BIS7 TaxID=1217718 RepID=UPI0003735E90|nr:LssY C-terminal domain-containing protein [Cupriavidus sp. BIS7]